MTQKINAIIDRPVTDLRHFTSVLNAEPRVRHMWSAVREKTYRDPVDGLLRFPARKGDLPLVANDDDGEWSDRGNYEIPMFPSGSAGKYQVTIPSPGSVFSILMNSNRPANALEAWSVNWQDGSYIWYAPARTSGQPTLNNGAHITLPFTAGPLNEWNFDAVVIDLGNAIAAGSVNGGEFGEVTGVPDFAPKTGAINLTFGYFSTGQPFGPGGMISDLAVVQGDVRTSPDLLSAWQAYNQSAYSG